MNSRGWRIVAFLMLAFWESESHAEENDSQDEEDLQEGQIRLLSVDYPMVVPENTRVKLLITGNDVMHSFFVPSLAVQVCGEL